VASFRGHDQIVQRLLEKGADVNERGRLYDDALRVASAKGHDQIVQQLIEALQQIGKPPRASGSRFAGRQSPYA
jgi:ankyrin repeat protein